VCNTPVLCTLCDRSRPRSTRVNRRFLARTVASATRSRPSRGRATSSATATCGEIQETQRCSETIAELEHRQHHVGASDYCQRRTATDRKANKRKHAAGDDQSKCGCSTRDWEQTDVYDVYDYIRLNEQHELEKKPKTITGHSIGTHCSGSQTK